MNFSVKLQSLEWNSLHLLDVFSVRVIECKIIRSFNPNEDDVSTVVRISG